MVIQGFNMKLIPGNDMHEPYCEIIACKHYLNKKDAYFHYLSLNTYVNSFSLSMYSCNYSTFPHVTTEWHILRLQMDEKASSYEG
jgi:hypothetical protein